MITPIKTKVDKKGDGIEIRFFYPIVDTIIELTHVQAARLIKQIKEAYGNQ